MRGAVLYSPCDLRCEEREALRIIKPTDTIIRMPVTSACGSDL
jgi:threonine dehydrogenase-like Zn-dependent dehydrogenase